MKVFEYKLEHEGKVHCHQYHVFCPGCKTVHAIGVGIHTFNGNFESPTFQPSLLTYGHKFKEPMSESNHETVEFRCHSYVTNGRIQFLGDCSHELKNQTVDLPEFKEEHKRL